MRELARTDRQTDRQTDRPSTVTLAAHGHDSTDWDCHMDGVRRGLSKPMPLNAWYMHTLCINKYTIFQSLSTSVQTPLKWSLHDIICMSEMHGKGVATGWPYYRSRRGAERSRAWPSGSTGFLDSLTMTVSTERPTSTEWNSLASCARCNTG